MCRIVAFISSAGGLGQTSIIEMLSKKLAKQDFKVFALDANFCMNDLSLRFECDEKSDLKDYLSGNCNCGDVINYGKCGVDFVQTNCASYDYIKHTELIKYFIDMISKNYDFILIDSNAFSSKVLSLTLNLCNEVICITSDESASVVNCAKLLKLLQMYKNIKNKKLIINKARLVLQSKKRALNEHDIFEVLKTEILFVFPYFFKGNIFRKNADEKNRKFAEEFCYSFITNDRRQSDYMSAYRGVLGGIRKILHSKYE